MLKLPNAYNFDFCAMKNHRFVGWLEVKRRYRMFEKYPTVPFSLLKLMRAVELNTLTGKPCFFAAQFDDRLVVANVLESRGQYGWFGRDDRDDPQDMEPVLLIPNDEFTTLEIAKVQTLRV